MQRKDITELKMAPLWGEANAAPTEAPVVEMPRTVAQELAHAYSQWPKEAQAFMAFGLLLSVTVLTIVLATLVTTFLTRLFRGYPPPAEIVSLGDCDCEDDDDNEDDLFS